MNLHWGIAISESTFIRDTIILLDILHWDTLHSLMIDFWDDGLFRDMIASKIVYGRHNHSIFIFFYFCVEHEMIRVYWDYIGIFIFHIERWDWPYYDYTYWDISLSLVMDFDLSWSIVTLDGLYWDIATSFTFIEHEDSDSYGLCWDVSIFSIRSRDWLICWHTLRMILLSSCLLRYTTLYWGIIGMKNIFHWGITT